MNSFFKKSILFSGVAVLFFGGFGCQGVSQEQQASVKPVVLEYWTVYDDVAALQTQITKFQQLHPFITINLRQFGAGEIYTRLVEALAEDKGPDIISVNNRNLGQYLSKLASMPGSVIDTTQVTQKNQIGNDTVIINSVNHPLITIAQLEREYVQAVKGDVVRGGRIYGLPLSLDTMGLFYNKDLLDRAGIPEAPKTWEDFQVDVKKLTKFDKVANKIIQAGAALGTGSNVPGSDDILYILFRQSQIAFVDNAGRAVFNLVPQNTNKQQSPAISVMNFYTDFANPTRDTYTWNDAMPNALDSFTNGSLAFFFGYSFHYPIIKGRAPQLNFEVLPMLQLSAENPVNVANYSIQTVTQKSRHQNEAWNLIDFLTHSAATKAYLDQTGRPTALRFYISSQQSKLELAPFISQVLIATNWYKGNNYPAAQKAVQDMSAQWQQPAPDNNNINNWYSAILNQGAAKVNQTF
jgi:ABC-type glycerol-3-phosphate transport system substrate-binding protein